MAFDSKPARVPPPFAVAPAMLGWVRDRKLQLRLDEFAKEPKLRNLTAAVVDLSGAVQAPKLPAAVAYGGYRDEAQTYAASFVKAGIMLAAYRLREQVLEAADKLGIADLKGLASELQKEWLPLITEEAQGRPVKFPAIEQIFEPSVDARKTGFSADFSHQIDLMVEGVGKNSAAAFCAERLGFAYINGVLRTEGLLEGHFGRRDLKGISLSLDYGGHFWAGKEGGAAGQGATAKAMAAFFTALHTHNLVSKNASDDMMGHLSVATSWFKAGLLENQRKHVRTIGKIGVDGTFSEGAIIERPGDLKYIRYVAAVMGAPNFEILWQAIVKLDAIIEDRF
jgi:hypothetical protein